GRLDAVEVHRDVADVAGEPDATAVGRDSELLQVGSAIEYTRVTTGLRMQGFAAIAGVPDEGVVPIAHPDHVAAGAADEHVVAAVGAVDDDGVGLAVAVARGAIEVHVEFNKVSSALVVVDALSLHDALPIFGRLDAVEVHRDVADVAGEPEPTAVGRDLEPL